MTSDETFGPRGAAFWTWAVETFEPERHEAELLRQACRLLDRLDALQAAVVEHGTMMHGERGGLKPNPAIGEERQVSLALGRLLAQLDIPDEDGDAGIVSPTSARASKAARSRWNTVQARTGRRPA
jgi:hypothetical protein